MKLDDIEITPVYDNGEIVTLVIKCKRHIATMMRTGNKKGEKHFNIAPYTDKKHRLIGAKFMCDPGYDFTIQRCSMNNNTLDVIIEKKGKACTSGETNGSKNTDRNCTKP